MTLDQQVHDLEQRVTRLERLLERANILPSKKQEAAQRKAVEEGQQ